MDEKIINDINIILSKKIEKDIPCCEDSTNDYDAYNNLDKMYQSNNNHYSDISIFNEYLNISIDELSKMLDVDGNMLNNLFNINHIPSKGLSIAIGMALNINNDKLYEILNKLGYSLCNNDYDKIVNYFIDNNIYDISLLNETLLYYGQMYLYSKRKLR